MAGSLSTFGAKITVRDPRNFGTLPEPYIATHFGVPECLATFDIFFLTGRCFFRCGFLIVLLGERSHKIKFMSHNFNDQK